MDSWHCNNRTKQEMQKMTRVGIDAHKKSRTTCVFGDDILRSFSASQTFVSKTTTKGVAEFMEKVTFQAKKDVELPDPSKTNRV